MWKKLGHLIFVARMKAKDGGSFTPWNAFPGLLALKKSCGETRFFFGAIQGAGGPRQHTKLILCVVDSSTERVS